MTEETSETSERVKFMKELSLTQQWNHIETSERVKFMNGLNLTQQDEILF